MKTNFRSLPITIIGGFIALSLLNFLFRSSLVLINIFIILSFFLTVYIFRNQLIRIFNQLPKIRPVFLFSIIGVIGLISIFIFNPVLWDDALIFHNQVLKDISEGTIKTNNPYSIRGFLYLFPIYKFLGTNTLILELINYIFYLLSGFLFFKILEINFENNRKISILGVILFYSIPFFTLAINVPHWDLISTFYLMLFLYLMTNIFKKLPKAKHFFDLKLLLLSALSGASLIALFYTRGLMMAIVITFVLFSFLLFLNRDNTVLQKIRIVTFSVIIPLMFFFTVDLYLKQSSFFDNTETNRSTAQMLFSYNDTRFDGATEHHDKKWVYMPQIPTRLKMPYAIKKLNSEINYNWQWYLFRLSSKSKELYSIGGLNNFILHDTPNNNIRANFLCYWKLFVQLIINFFAILGLLIFLRKKRKENLFILFTIAFTFTSTFFGLFSEAKSRYSLLFVYGLIILALLGLDSFTDVKKKINFKDVKSFLVKLFVAAGILLITFFAYRELIAKNYSFEQLKERNWKKEIGQVNFSAFQKQISQKDEILKLNNSNMHHNLSFFLRTSKLNIDNLKIALTDGLIFKQIQINKDSFNALLSDQEIITGFFELNISDFKASKISLDFSESDLNYPIIVEYVSFNN